ncbi:ribose-5-phosphate isomerase RpiA [Pediococcus argentinicus]|uniref:Ribose-5-phosphate isomerase A n=1 Tax=Pediococcus argentinicus TaxID=480391 RepID=A0A0R2NJ36_9LACO|nr:ribose-5-phosphate isomerase RpiA [Pediococcus argentinicus]KRO25801.1 ribose-5-phosphate isomerase A [Pediococcus argentinicus]NKZ21968.1 ribose-5-phosphate isomerase RpiA [Pediococcus argentinicus]GEP19137.1 ribose-5-phosphate isomerase A [Pediococcus argentinicus]
MDQNELKKLVGEEAVKFIEDNMVVGLGTGSTVKFMVDALGARVKNEGLHIVGVPTSNRTAEQARSLGITVKSVDEVDHIDLTIDGADEISNDFQGIKGGGAAHLFEKIVATNSNKVMWIVDESKMVHKLGKFPLPLEVIPYGSKQVFKKLEKKGLHPEFRMDEQGKHVLTDSENYVIDLHLGEIDHPHELADYLIKEVGIVEQGLFLDMVNTVIVGRQDGPEVLQAR